jgi:hypothetical protein
MRVGVGAEYAVLFRRPEVALVTGGGRGITVASDDARWVTGRVIGAAGL